MVFIPSPVRHRQISRGTTFLLRSFFNVKFQKLVRDKLLKNLSLPLVASRTVREHQNQKYAYGPIDSIGQLLSITVGRNVPAEGILSIKLLMGFVYETLEDLLNVWLLNRSCSSHGQKKCATTYLFMLAVRYCLIDKT